MTLLIYDDVAHVSNAIGKHLFLKYCVLSGGWQTFFLIVVLQIMATASIFKNWRTTLERIEKYVSPIYFADANLHSRLYPQRRVITDVFHGGSPIVSSTVKLCESQRPSFEDAIKQTFSKHVGIGSSFGPTWATHWFKVS